MKVDGVEVGAIGASVVEAGGLVFEGVMVDGHSMYGHVAWGCLEVEIIVAVFLKTVMGWGLHV